MPDGVFPVKPKGNARAGIDFAERPRDSGRHMTASSQYALDKRGSKSGQDGLVAPSLAAPSLAVLALVALATTSAHRAETLRRSDRA